MEVYITLFLLLVIASLFEISGFEYKKITKIIIAVLLIGLSGFRYEVGNDFNNYVLIFNNPDAFSTIEPGFIWIIKTIQLFQYNAQALFLLSSLLIVVPLAYTINKFFPQYYCTALSVYVLSYIYFEGMNTVRQAIGMSFVFVGFCHYIKDNKILYLVVSAIIASLFHYSAIVVVIVGWGMLKITGKELNVTGFVVAIIVSFVAGRFINVFSDTIGRMASWMNYSFYMDSFEQRGVNSGAFQYLLNIYAFASLAYVYKNKHALSVHEKSYIKLFLTGIMIYNFFINFFIGLRFYWYLYLFIIFTIPIIISHCNKKNRGLFYLAIISVIIIYTILSLQSQYYYNYNYNYNFTRWI